MTDTAKQSTVQSGDEPGVVARVRGSKFWREWRGFIVFVIVMLIFRSSIADWNQVPSGSMKPGILEGDRVMVNKLAYDLRVPFTLVRIAWFDEPQRGDIVTFPSPQDERLFIKRIVGVPGDRIEMRDNVLTINGERAGYNELSRAEVDALEVSNKYQFRFFQEEVLGDDRLIMLLDNGFARGDPDPVTLGPDEYWMMGDNRDQSGDSRSIGVVTRDRILGRAHGIAFSWDYMQFQSPRWNRFFESFPD